MARRALFVDRGGYLRGRGRRVVAPVPRCRWCGGHGRAELATHDPVTHSFTFTSCCEERQNELLAELEAGAWSHDAIARWLRSEGLRVRSLGETHGGLNFSIDYGITIVPSTTKLARARGLAPPGSLIRDEILAYVRAHHRHAGDRTPAGYLWAYAVYNGPTLVGVAMVGRTPSRELEKSYERQGLRVCDVTRMALDHRLEPHLTYKAASMIYTLAAADAEARGYDWIITYTLASERGMSLRYARWKVLAEGRGGGQWGRDARPRAPRSGEVAEKKTLWGRQLHPDRQRVRRVEGPGQGTLFNPAFLAV